MKSIERKLKEELGKGIVIGGCLILSVVILTLTIIYLLYGSPSNKNELYLKEVIPPIIQEIIDECSNKSLFNSSECVNDRIIPLFYYNLSNAEKNINFDELFEEGGVCRHWASLYSRIGQELGFYTNTPTFEIEKKYETFNGKEDEYMFSHTVCVWSNVEGYVVLDQTNIEKSSLKS